MLTRRMFIQSGAALAAGAAAGGIAFPKGSMKGDGAVGFPEHLNLLNQCSDDRYPMRLIHEAPIELSPGGCYDLSHYVSCGLREAVAVFGIEIQANGPTEEMEVGLMIDGECVFKSALKNVSAFAETFLASKDMFLAETPAGSIAGLFVPNGTRVEIFFLRNSSCPTTIRTTLRTATYRVQGHGPINIRLRLHPNDHHIVVQGSLLIDEPRDVFGIHFIRETALGRVVELSLSRIKAVMEPGGGLAPMFVGKHGDQEVRAAGTVWSPEDVGLLAIWNHNPTGLQRSWGMVLLDSDIERVLGNLT